MCPLVLTKEFIDPGCQILANMTNITSTTATIPDKIFNKQIGDDQKNFDICLHVVLDHYYQSFYFWKGNSTLGLVTNPILRFFLIFTSFSFKSFRNLWNSMYLKFLLLDIFFFTVLTKTRNDLKRPQTTYNDLQQARNDLKRPRTIYNEQETTWNNLQRPTTSKKRPETTYNEQETIWNDLQRARNNMKWPTRTWKDLQRTKNNR